MSGKEGGAVLAMIRILRIAKQCGTEAIRRTYGRRGRRENAPLTLACMEEGSNGHFNSILHPTIST